MTEFFCELICQLVFPRSLRVMCLGVLLYGAESWNMTRAISNKIDTFQTRCLCRLLSTEHLFAKHHIQWRAVYQGLQWGRHHLKREREEDQKRPGEDKLRNKWRILTGDGNRSRDGDKTYLHGGLWWWPYEI